MNRSFSAAVARADLEELVSACHRLRLTPDETASVLARARSMPGLLDLVRQHGGDAAEFVRARLEIRELIRSGA